MVNRCVRQTHGHKVCFCESEPLGICLRVFLVGARFEFTRAQERIEPRRHGGVVKFAKAHFLFHE